MHRMIKMHARPRQTDGRTKIVANSTTIRSKEGIAR